MVIDTSAILALLFNEPQASWIAGVLEDHAGDLCMSTVNLAETLILLRDRQPRLADELEERLFTSSIRFVPPTPDHARLAARARAKYPLNLGDCFAYALALDQDLPLLTLDRDFRRTGLKLVTPPTN